MRSERTYLQHRKIHRHRENTHGCQGGRVGPREGLGVWGYQMQPILCRMERPKRPPVEYREVYAILWRNLIGKVI